MTIENIPSSNFDNRHRKAFEFVMIGNKEILMKQLPTDHDPFRPHRVRYYAILFIMGGEGTHHIDFKSYAYKKGSLIFISKEQVQRFEHNVDRDALFLLFTDQFLEKGSLGSKLMQQLSLYNYHLYPPVMQLNDVQYATFYQILQQMHEEYHRPDDFATEEIMLASLKILLFLAERTRKSNQVEKIPSLYHKEFLQFQELLNTHLLTNRQVQFYADQMAISTKKLNRITQDIVQQSTKDYIHEMLTTEMKRFLVNTNLSIKEIAYKTGFDEATNFVKYFKKYAGLTPVQFRKRY